VLAQPWVGHVPLQADFLPKISNICKHGQDQSTNRPHMTSGLFLNIPPVGGHARLKLTPAPLRSSSSPPPLSASFSFSSLSSPAPCFHLRIRPWRARHLRGLRLGEDCLVLSPCSGPPPHRPFLSVSQPLQSVVACGRTAVGLMAQSSCATEHAVFLASGVVRVVPAAIQDAGIAWPSIYMLSVFCSRRPEPLCGWL